MRLGAALMIVAAASAACKGKSGADDPNTLVVISPHDETIRGEFTIAFERSEREAGRASRVRWQPARGTGNIMRFLENEFASAKSGRPVGVDVFFGGGVPAFEAARKAGYLEPIAVDPALVESVPASWGGLPFRAEDGSWYGATVNGFGIFFHRKGHAARGWDEPRAWADLANPRYAGLIEMADATESGSAQAAYEMVLEQHGWDEGWPLLHRMAANSASFPRSSSDVVRDVSTGQVLAGMSIDFYAYTQIAETGKDVVGFSVPEGGTAWTPDPIAVIRGTAKKGLAARFVAFVLSEKGQGLWALPVGALGGPTKKALFRPPILPSLYDGKEPLLVEVDPYAVPPGFAIDRELFETRSKLIGPLIEVSCIQLKEKIGRAWKAVREHPDDARMAALFDALPFAAGEALGIAAGMGDPVKAEGIEEGWYRFFEAKYEEIARLAEGAGDG